ncbi:hypothetical protein Tco_1089215, partial [Tanacetum coccineum]
EDLIESNLKPCIAATKTEDRDASRLEVPDLVSQEFNAQAPKIIEELFKNYVQSNLIQMKRSLQDQANDPALDDDIHSHHDDRQEDDASPEGEKRVKRHKALKISKSTRGSSSKHSTKDSTTCVSKQQQQQEWDAWVEEIMIDEDEVISEDETPKLITKLQNVDKCVPTIYDYEIMRATLNDALSNQFKNAEEYAYHLEQTTNFMENQIVWESRQEDIRRLVPRPLYGNTKEKKYILSLHKIHAERFLEFDLEEKMNRWITKVVRITTDQPHGLDFMEQIFVMRENDKPDSFSEADFKSRVIWERVHNFQLRIESYQIKVNLTAPTLTFPSIEAHEPYSIVDKPSTGLIYLNSKNEKRVMYLTEFVKFCDSTLEKVLKEVKLKIFQSEPWRKPHLLGELDHDISRAFEREITKRLSHREQMRRWESFVNRRPILSTMKHL